MVKQREGYKVVITEPAKTRIKNNQCPACGKPKEQWTRRKDWRCCSTECTNKFMKMYYSDGWPDFRMRVLKRDNYTCVKCGKKPKQRMSIDYYGKEHIEKNYVVLGYEKNKYGKEVAIVDSVDPSQLIADHIVPIAVGGDEWDMDNIQTLCIDCNKKKTKRDAWKIAVQRVIDKARAKNKVLMEYYEKI